MEAQLSLDLAWPEVVVREGVGTIRDAASPASDANRRDDAADVIRVRPDVAEAPTTFPAPVTSRRPDWSLAAVIAALRQREDLPATRRRDLVSAVRTTARLLRRAPEHLPAAVPALRAALAGVHPVAAGISAKRFANIRADLAAALRLAGQMRMACRVAPGLDPAWQQLREVCPLPRLRWALSRLMRWCSSCDITPEQVDPAVLARCTDAIDASSLKTEPARIALDTARAWNQCARIVPRWPGRPLPTTARQPGWVLPWSSFPSALQADAEAWIARLGGDDPLADDGPPRPLRPATLRWRRFQMRMAVSALVRFGVPLEDLQSLEDLARPGRFKAILRHQLERHGGPKEALYGLASTLRAIARHHATLPAAELDELHRLAGRVLVKSTGLSRQNRDRLRPFDDRVNVDRLLTLPQVLMRKAGCPGCPPQRAAMHAQTAVAIEILLAAPIRIGNLAALRLGEHVLFSGPPRAEQLVIVLAGREVKNGMALEFPLPVESARLIRRYVEHHLPELAKLGGGHLFPNASGSGKHPRTLGAQIKAAVRKATGHTVNPHLFRHLGAKLYLDGHPGAYEAVRRVLGHQSIDTTTTFYTGLEAATAARHFDANLLSQRRAAEAALGGKRPTLTRKPGPRP